jgi:hypothetical protein
MHYLSYVANCCNWIYGMWFPTDSSLEAASEKISSLNASQIELIGDKIVMSVMKNLGPNGKFRVAKIVHKDVQNMDSPNTYPFNSDAHARGR